MTDIALVGPSPSTQRELSPVPGIETLSGISSARAVFFSYSIATTRVVSSAMIGLLLTPGAIDTAFLPRSSTAIPTEPVQLRPGRAVVRGMARMLDFTGVLSRQARPRRAEEDMALAWRDVLSVVKPPHAEGRPH